MTTNVELRDDEPAKLDSIWIVYRQQAYDSYFECLGWYASEAEAESVAARLNERPATREAYEAFLSRFPREGRLEVTQDATAVRDLTFEEWREKFVRPSQDHSVVRCDRGSA